MNIYNCKALHKPTVTYRGKHIYISACLYIHGHMHIFTYIGIHNHISMHTYNKNSLHIHTCVYIYIHKQIIIIRGYLFTLKGIHTLTYAYI